MAHHVCPWWIGYFLLNPVRRLGQNPQRVLGPYVQTGMTVLEVGCAMGFFTLDLARMVGPGGRIVAVDLQPRMIATLERRARRAGLDGLIEARVCPEDSLTVDDLAGCVDFALAFAVAHEVPDQARLMVELRAAVRDGGQLLVSEPAGHVTRNEFETSVTVAEEAGFSVIGRPAIARSRSVVLAPTPVTPGIGPDEIGNPGGPGGHRV